MQPDIILDFGPTVLIWDLHNYSKEVKKIQIVLGEIVFWEISESQKSKMLEKTRAGNSLRSVLSILENLEYGINIFRKNKGELCFFHFN